jgi:hypothetical protein
MQLRRPLDLLFALGSLGWPVGLFAFGGFNNDTGATIIGVGSLLVLASIAVELLLRGRARRRAGRTASPGSSGE